MATMRVLLRADQPPADALEIIAGVYQVPPDNIDDELLNNDRTLRFYLGYAGWAPGQLDRELRFGSWWVVPATADTVFSPEPESVWRALRPPPEYRAEQTPANVVVARFGSGHEPSLVSR